MKNSEMICFAADCTKNRYVGLYCFGHDRRFRLGGESELHRDEDIQSARKFCSKEPRTLSAVSEQFSMSITRARELLAQAACCPVFVIENAVYYSGKREDGQHTMSLVMETLRKHPTKDSAALAVLTGRSEMTIRSMVKYLFKAKLIHIGEWVVDEHHHVPQYNFGPGRNASKPKALTNKQCNERRMNREKKDTNLMMDRLARQRRYYHKTSGKLKRDIAATALFGTSTKSVDD